MIRVAGFLVACLSSGWSNGGNQVASWAFSAFQHQISLYAGLVSRKQEVVCILVSESAKIDTGQFKGKMKKWQMFWGSPKSQKLSHVNHENIGERNANYLFIVFFQLFSFFFDCFGETATLNPIQPRFRAPWLRWGCFPCGVIWRLQERQWLAFVERARTQAPRANQLCVMASDLNSVFAIKWWIALNLGWKLGFMLALSISCMYFLT